MTPYHVCNVRTHVRTCICTHVHAFAQCKKFENEKAGLVTPSERLYIPHCRHHRLLREYVRTVNRATAYAELPERFVEVLALVLVLVDFVCAGGKPE